MNDRTATAGVPETTKKLFQQIWIVTAVGLTAGLLVLSIRGGAIEPAPAVAATTCAAPSPLAVEPARVSAVEARRLLTSGETAFVDCRSAEEYQLGHVAGAVSLPAERLPLTDDALSHLSGATLVITYCDEACSRSSRVANHILESGFSDVRILTGGMTAWLDAGYPAESGACPLCATDNSEGL